MCVCVCVCVCLCVCVCVCTPCRWWSRGMMGCSSRRRRACTAASPRCRSSTCLWSCEAGSCASHRRPAETPGGTMMTSSGVSYNYRYLHMSYFILMDETVSMVMSWRLSAHRSLFLDWTVKPEHDTSCRASVIGC